MGLPARLMANNATSVDAIDAITTVPSNVPVSSEKPIPKPSTPVADADPVPSVPHPLDDLILGYPKIAGRMGLIPETAMFRRFGALNARNLLYLQSDLTRTENKLKKLELQDSQSEKGKKKNYALSHFWLQTASVQRDGDVQQKELVLKLRETLHQYNHALIQQHTILQMGVPDAYDLQNMKAFLESEMMNHGHSLEGADMDTWGSPGQSNDHSPELIVLRARESTDNFSRKLSSWAVPLFTKLAFKSSWQKPNPTYGALTVREDRVFMITLWITSVIASMLPVVSIIILVTLEKLDQRLAVIAALNALLTVCLLVFTDAKRTEIFSVTAAFTAVQVVFVGQALSNGPQPVYIVNRPG
ncbi:phthalate transporter [Pyrenophora seminiperda CCB06]|uniref:Phthalate transporter n=1 Tax=Pyrenophora seminiperda CCB06 TaxID=1302712 RepID=A0A3M7LZT4_9PLEO|nr:phthalate transporter [Pyrenophora seminiperda CCB06]